MDFYIIRDSDELYHHGILGMKWGVRRYQNSDGSLTSAGKHRYNKEMAKLKSEEKVIKNREKTRDKMAKLEAKRKDIEARKKALDEEDSKKDGTGSKKHHGTSSENQKKVSEMTNEEIQAKIDRINLEKRYSDLVSEKTNPKSAPSKGQKIVEEILTNSAKNIGTQTVTFIMGKTVNKALEGIYNDKDSINPKKGQKDK